MISNCIEIGQAKIQIVIANPDGIIADGVQGLDQWMFVRDRLRREESAQCTTLQDIAVVKQEAGHPLSLCLGAGLADLRRKSGQAKMPPLGVGVVVIAVQLQMQVRGGQNPKTDCRSPVVIRAERRRGECCVKCGHTRPPVKQVDLIH